MRKLLVATHNQGKVSEYRELLGDLPLFLTSLDDQGITDVVEETGETFVENASLKAQAYAQMSMLWTWADDSGLVVDILDGRPAYSPRVMAVRKPVIVIAMKSYWMICARIPKLNGRRVFSVWWRLLFPTARSLPPKAVSKA